MKRLALGFLVPLAAVAAISVPQAQAAPSRQADLAAQVKALSAQVKALTAQVNKLKKQESVDRNEIAANYEGDACLSAITGDALQGTWLQMDKLDVPVLNATVFGTQVPLDDKGACSDLSVTRKMLAAPPAVDVFTSLIKWIAGG